MKRTLFPLASLLVTLSLALVSAPAVAEPTVAQAKSAAAEAPASAPDPAQVTETLRSSPVMFIENVGQFDEGARFQVRGAMGASIWLADNAIWVTLVDLPHGEQGSQASPDSHDIAVGLEPRTASSIRLTLAGANPNARIVPFDRLDTKVSYFIGNDANQWYTDVPVWGGVLYEDLYPGIDLELAGESGEYSQRLVARPPGDLSAVRLKIEGADQVELVDHIMHLSAAAGSFAVPLLTLSDGIPIGEAACSNVNPGTFEILSPFSHSHTASPTVAYRHGSDDLFYSTFLGGSKGQGARAIAVDWKGEAYVAGETWSPDFPVTPGAFDTKLLRSDAYVAKLNADGTDLVYATFLGGNATNSSEDANAIAIDPEGNVYVTGDTTAPDFPTTPGAFDTSCGSNGNCNSWWSDGFVVKLNTDGTNLEYGAFIGGSERDWGHAIAVNALGEATVAGDTRSLDFRPTPGAYDTIYNGGNWDAFVLTVDADGRDLKYATFLGGSQNDTALGVATDRAGNAYVTGWTHSVDFPVTSGAYDVSHSGEQDVFVTKLGTNGRHLEYSTFHGGTKEEEGMGIAVDSGGSAYVTGLTSSRDLPTTPGSFDTSCGTDGWCNDHRDDAFVFKLNSNGSDLHYSAFLGGGGDEFGASIAVDSGGSAYVTGSTASIGFPTTPGAFDASCGVDGWCDEYYGDAFVVKVKADGSELAYSTYLGGGDTDNGAAIAVDGEGHAYVAGTTGSSEFPTTPEAFDISRGEGQDAFVTKLALGGGILPYGSLRFLLNQFVDTTIEGLSQIEADAWAIASDGDYFRGAVGADAAELAVGVVFNMADVIWGLHQAGHLDGLKKGAQVGCPGCYVPGTSNTLFRTDNPAAARLFDIGFTRLEDALASKIAEFVGWGGPRWYGKVLNTGARLITKKAAKSATRTVFATTADGMSEIAYPAISDTANELSTTIDLQRGRLLANMPIMTAEDQDAYGSDLTGRARASLVMEQQLDDERVTLAEFREEHEQHQDTNWLDVLLRFTAKGLASAIFDGAGTAAVGGAFLLFDGYMDGKQLDESMQMHGLASGALIGAPDAMRQTYANAYSGLDRIARGLPADRATGEITGVVHQNQGSGWGPFWKETASWSEVSLTNTGDSETTFRVLVRYLADTTRFSVPWATMDLMEEATISLPRDASGTLRVDYKRDDGTRGFSPREQKCLPVIGCVPASSIDVQVLGTNEAGTCYIDNHLSTWQAIIPLTSTGTRAPAAMEDRPTIDPPLTTYVLSAPWTQKHEALLWISNPFTSTLPVTVTQGLPPDVTVLDSGGAVESDSTLTWNRVVSPTSLSVVTFTFAFPAVPGTEHTLPPGNLSLVNPLDGQPLEADSNAASFEAIWPLTVDYATPGYVLPGSSPTVAMTVTNWLTDSEITGALGISITDAMSTTVHADSEPFSIAADTSGTIAFTLPTTLAPGDHLVHGSVSASGTSARVFVDHLQVGLPGPWLDYQVSPMGAVGAHDILTYTVQFSNTIGVPLTGAVLTASLPSSVTVVPGSVTGGGVDESDHVRWALDEVSEEQAVQESFCLEVSADAVPPGGEPGRLLSEPRLTANEIAPTWGPLAWNLVGAPLVSVGVSGPATGLVEDDYTFSAAVGPETATLPVAYVWTATGQAPVTQTVGLSNTLAFAWDAAGSKTITVTATNATSTVTGTHTISICAPVEASFTAWPTSGVAPLDVSFTNLSSGDYVTSLWDFGDDVTSTLESPTHTYGTADIYTVTLAVTGPGGSDAETETAYITVWQQYREYLPIVLRRCP